MSNQQNGAGQDMDKSSLRLRIEKALYNDEFQEELSRYGFTSTAEVAAFPRFNALLTATKAKTGDTALPTYKFYTDWIESTENGISRLVIDNWFQQLIDKGILDVYGLVKDVDKYFAQSKI